MPKETLTITVEAERRAELERIAKAQAREREAVIDEALASWLNLQASQTR